MLVKFLKKYKYSIIYFFAILLLILLFNILLEEKVVNAVFCMAFILGFTFIVLLLKSKVSLTNLGFGITRKQLQKKLLINILYLLIITLFILFYDILTVYIIYENIEIAILKNMNIYLFAIIISFVISIIVSIIKNFKLLLPVITIIATLIIVMIFVKIELYKLIIYIILIILLYIENNYISFKKNV